MTIPIIIPIMYGRDYSTVQYNESIMAKTDDR